MKHRLSLQERRVEDQGHVKTVYFVAHGDLGHAVIARDQKHGMRKIGAARIGGEKGPERVIGIKDAGILIPVKPVF